MLERYPEKVPAKYWNSYVNRGITSMENAKAVIGTFAEDARWWMNEGAGWAMHPITEGKQVDIFAFVEDNKPWKGEQAARKAVTILKVLAKDESTHLHLQRPSLKC